MNTWNNRIPAESIHEIKKNQNEDTSEEDFCLDVGDKLRIGEQHVCDSINRVCIEILKIQFGNLWIKYPFYWKTTFILFLQMSSILVERFLGKFFGKAIHNRSK